MPVKNTSIVYVQTQNLEMHDKSECLKLEDGSFVWIYACPNRMYAAKDFFADWSWPRIREKLLDEYDTKFTDSEWNGLRALLCLKAAWHDVKGQQPLLFGPQTKEVDRAWHKYILASTFWYEQFNMQVFRTNIHHTRWNNAEDCRRLNSNTKAAIAMCFPGGLSDSVIPAMEANKLKRASASESSASAKRMRVATATSATTMQKDPAEHKTDDSDDSSQDDFVCCG